MATLQNLFRFNALASAGFGAQFIFRPKSFFEELGYSKNKPAGFSDGVSLVAWQWGLGIQPPLAAMQLVIAELPHEHQIPFAKLMSLWWALDVFIVVHPAPEKTNPGMLFNAGFMAAMSLAFAYFGWFAEHQKGGKKQ